MSMAWILEIKMYIIFLQKPYSHYLICISSRPLILIFLFYHDRPPACPLYYRFIRLPARPPSSSLLFFFVSYPYTAARERNTAWLDKNTTQQKKYNTHTRIARATPHCASWLGGTLPHPINNFLFFFFSDSTPPVGLRYCSFSRILPSPTLHC
ncbi:hypothetical protein BC828DRAFT_284018 [Blastocladiella britannica]|nr:hypothetical protein BC828DRAFT_284018 [Blastocladiella britannica]